MYLVHIDIPCIYSLLLSVSLDLSVIRRPVDNILLTLLCLFLITYRLNESSQDWLGLFAHQKLLTSRRG